MPSNGGLWLFLLTDTSPAGPPGWASLQGAGAAEAAATMGPARLLPTTVDAVAPLVAEAGHG